MLMILPVRYTLCTVLNSKVFGSKAEMITLPTASAKTKILPYASHFIIITSELNKSALYCDLPLCASHTTIYPSANPATKKFGTNGCTASEQILEFVYIAFIGSFEEGAFVYTPFSFI